MLKKLLLAAAMIAATQLVQARSYETCLSGVVVSNAGVSAPYSLRQCFGYKMSKADADATLAALGFSWKASSAYVHHYSDGVAWIALYLDAYGRVSEITLVIDSPM